MATEILLPAVSPDPVTLARWLKKEGDAIRKGDILAEVESDKAMLEVESVHEGILSKILVPEGTAEVRANSKIALVVQPGEEIAKPVEQSAKAHINTQQDVTRRDVSPGNGAEASQRIFASPRARRLAGEAGVNLSTLRGSGPRGRIIEKDILAAKGKTHSAAADPRIVPHDAMRKSIARRLSEAKQTIPHFYVAIDCEIDALLKMKEDINQAAPRALDGTPEYKLSVNDLVIKAWALALWRTPEANVSWTDEGMVHHEHVDVAVAVSLPGGLITPIVRQAEIKSVSVISKAMKALAARAKAKKLKAEEFEGGGTSISNLGMLGVKEFAAILNPPQATILAVGAGEKRMVVRNDQPAVATVMSCTLSVDHRAIDGALGAQVLAAFKRLIENPISLFV